MEASEGTPSDFGPEVQPGYDWARLRRHAKHVARARGVVSGTALDDVAQEVATKIVVASDRGRFPSELAQQLAWVETTTNRHLIDQARKAASERRFVKSYMITHGHLAWNRCSAGAGGAVGRSREEQRPVVLGAEEAGVDRAALCDELQSLLRPSLLECFDSLWPHLDEASLNTLIAYLKSDNATEAAESLGIGVRAYHARKKNVFALLERFAARMAVWAFLALPYLCLAVFAITAFTWIACSYGGTVTDLIAKAGIDGLLSTLARGLFVIELGYLVRGIWQYGRICYQRGRQSADRGLRAYGATSRQADAIRHARRAFLREMNVLKEAEVRRSSVNLRGLDHNVADN